MPVFVMSQPCQFKTVFFILSLTLLICAGEVNEGLPLVVSSEQLLQPLMEGERIL